MPQLDFSELVQLISRELDTAIIYHNNSVASQKERLHVSSVRVSLGQLSPADRPEESTQPAIGDPLEKVNPPLLLDRYPIAGNGWKMELEMKSGPAPPRARSDDGYWFRLPSKVVPTVGVLFLKMPVKVIKGIDNKWSERLGEIGINSVKQIMALDYRQLNQLQVKFRSNYPMELKFKARLLNFAIPYIPASLVDGYTIPDLLLKAPEELRRMIGKNLISSSDSEQLSQLISLLYTVIDNRVLKGVTVKKLRLAKANS